MLRNHSDDKISDRFITGRNGERERILDKFKVEEEKHKKYLDDLYLTPRDKSKNKNRQLNFIEDDEVFNQKIYLNLLKSQIFEGRTTCSQEKKINTDKKLSSKNYKSSMNIKLIDNNIGKDLNKAFFNNINVINNNNASSTSNNINTNCILTSYTNRKTKSNPAISNNISLLSKKNNNTYSNNLISSNYSLMMTKKTKSLLLKKRLFEDNKKNKSKYGNLFKQSFSDFLNFEIDDNDTTINYLKYKSIPKIAYKVLDAPNLRDDFYLHLVDWSKQDIVAVGLDNKYPNLCVDQSNALIALVCELIFFSDSSFLISHINNLLSSPPDANLLSSKDHFIPQISLLCPTYFIIGLNLLLKSIVFMTKSFAPILKMFGFKFMGLTTHILPSLKSLYIFKFFDFSTFLTYIVPSLEQLIKIFPSLL